MSSSNFPSAEFLELPRISGKQFTPYLYIRSASSTPMTRPAAGGDSFSVLYLPDGASLESAVQRAVLHYRNETAGGSSVYGNVLEYWFVWLPTAAVTISVTGEVTGKLSGTFWPWSRSMEATATAV